MKIQELIINGYLYSGAFYEDSSHNVRILNDEGKLYRDITSKDVYIFNGSSYELFAGKSLDTQLKAISGYDATKTQTLKNDNGTLKFVNDVTGE